eukprot:3938102-Rhodomonas_salina.2
MLACAMTCVADTFCWGQTSDCGAWLCVQASDSGGSKDKKEPMVIDFGSAESEPAPHAPGHYHHAGAMPGTASVLG